MGKKPVLGKGINALIPEHPDSGGPDESDALWDSDSPSGTTSRGCWARGRTLVIYFQLRMIYW